MGREQGKFKMSMENSVSPSKGAHTHKKTLGIIKYSSQPEGAPTGERNCPSD